MMLTFFVGPLSDEKSQLLRRHRADDSINKAIGKLIRADLVVIDTSDSCPCRPTRPRRCFG